MCTGARAFDGESDFRVIENVRDACVVPCNELNAQIPAQLARLVARALAAKPAQRFASAAEMSLALGALDVLDEAKHGAADLAHWLRACFPDRYASERAALDRCTPSAPPPPPPADGQHELDQLIAAFAHHKTHAD
jgi:hypothetical protein